ncbi:MAG TPA: hypothetical protein VIT43_04470 [Candidatus Dormibacteraeota bacterium]
MASRRFLGGICCLLAIVVLAGCGEDQSQGTPLQASVSPTVGCKGAQGYQHTTLSYHLCYPSGWTVRDYTAEPGSGGAVSVVAFGPASAVPTHVPTSGTFTPPIEVRVVAGSKADVEQSLVQGNQVTATTVGGIAADKISVVDAGTASGTVIVVFEHQGNTYELEEAPGGAYDSAFGQLVSTFGFSAG